MTRKNIKVPEPLFGRLKDDKGKHRSWPQYLRDQLDDGGEDMDGVESSLQAIEERTGRIEQTLEELAGERR